MRSDELPQRSSSKITAVEYPFNVTKKNRIPIPGIVAARALFSHDRTCCVCRRRKPVQIHHMDDDPSNNAEGNLAVLCFDCHRETQISGGFDRKLDFEQVKLYRDDWVDAVRAGRSSLAGLSPLPEGADARIRVFAAQVEVYKEQGEWFRLGRLYHDIGDSTLRDKYFALARQEGVSAATDLLMASIEGKLSEVSPERTEEALELVADDWTTTAGILEDLGRVKESVMVLLGGIEKAMREDHYFLAAYYIKHALSDLASKLFEMALAEDIENDDIWWQIRCYEELGWDSEVKSLLIARENAIRNSGNLLLLRKLALAMGNDDEYVELERRIAGDGYRAFISVAVESENEPEPQA